MSDLIRYPDSIEPVRTDGRDIDPALGTLLGEGSSQRTGGALDTHMGSLAHGWNRLPEPDENDPSYYGVPMLQEPVWEWAIPVYYYVGGLTGVSLALGAAAQTLTPSTSLALVRRCHWIGFSGCVISGVLLVWDLGRPSRFLNMLRVFRPTSPMNVGAWILSGTGGAASGALLLSYLPAAFTSIARTASISAGVFGLGLATYTGVLVANSAIPVWQASRKVLPLLFGSSAMASSGCVLQLFPQNKADTRMANFLASIGRAMELILAHTMERHASEVPRVGRPFREGLTAVLWRAAEICTATTLVLSLLPRPTRNRRITAALLGTAGSLLLRISVAHLGTVSSRDAKASFHQQRAQRNHLELHSAASTDMPDCS